MSNKLHIHCQISNAQMTALNQTQLADLIRQEGTPAHLVPAEVVLRCVDIILADEQVLMVLDIAAAAKYVNVMTRVKRQLPADAPAAADPRDCETGREQS